MEKLAIFGGKPVRDKIIRYGHQWINDDDIKAVNEVLNSDFITTGPKAELLANKLTTYTGAKYAVAVANGTAALHCACLAIGIEQGDEIITTPLTFAASVNCILYCGGTPVFADINPDTYNIDPMSIRKCITNKTKAIIAVDFSGQPVQLDEIKKICDEYNIYLIEDASHSIGSTYKNKKIGSLTDITTFSFHPVKTITGGEGGAVLTNDIDIYEKVVKYACHGQNRDLPMGNEHYGETWYYDQEVLGYNYRITDFQAALIVSQLNRIDEFSKRRTQIANRYIEAFCNMKELILQKEIDDVYTCRHLFIIRLNTELLSCTRKEFFDALVAENVIPQIHYIPVYWFSYYKNLGYKKGLCPNAEKIYENIISIPLYPKMSDGDVETVISAVTKVVNFYRI